MSNIDAQRLLIGKCSVAVMKIWGGNAMPLRIDRSFTGDILRATGIPLSVLAALASGEWVAVPKEPTESMLDGARDWSYIALGKPVGNKDATVCYKSMLAAAPAEPDAAGGGE